MSANNSIKKRKRQNNMKDTACATRDIQRRD